VGRWEGEKVRRLERVENLFNREGKEGQHKGKEGKVTSLTPKGFQVISPENKNDRGLDKRWSAGDGKRDGLPQVEYKSVIIRFFPCHPCSIFSVNGSQPRSGDLFQRKKFTKRRKKKVKTRSTNFTNYTKR
jgi:hypothetical protein